MQDPLRQLLPYLPLIIAVLILIRRTQRPRTIRPWRLWIGPAIVLVATGFYTVSAIQHGPPVRPMDWLVMAGTATVGVALGVVRAHSVKLKRHPETGAIEATLSAWGLLIILAWIGGRMLLRNSGLVDVSTPFGLYTDATLSLALGVVLTQAVVLTRRCQAVVAQYTPSVEPQ
jgi:hypothetical protein